MRLRHVLLLVSALGAGASLVLAANFYTQLRNAERELFERNLQPGSDTILAGGSTHLIGLVAIAVMFMALFLLLLAAIRDAKFVAKIERTERPAEASAPSAMDTPPVPAPAIPEVAIAAELASPPPQTNAGPETPAPDATAMDADAPS